MKIFPWLLIIKQAVSCLIALALIQVLDDQVAVPRWVDARTVIAMTVVMPFVETVVFQFFIIELVNRLFGKSIVALIVGCVASAGAFFLVHCMSNSLFNGIAYGLVGGVIYAVMYGYERRNGAQRAFALTWFLHVLSNALLLLYWHLFGQILVAA
jgi:membrane protease YdiL (CAAX protease family)